MVAEVDKLEDDIASLRKSVAHIRGKLDALNAAEAERMLASVAGCISELLPLRLSLDSLKAARKNSH